VGVEVEGLHDAAVLRHSLFSEPNFDLVLVAHLKHLSHRHVLVLFEAALLNEGCIALLDLAKRDLLVHLCLADLVELLDLELRDPEEP